MERQAEYQANCQTTPILKQFLSDEQLEQLARLLQEIIEHGHGQIKIVVVDGRIAKHPFKIEKSY